MMIQYHCNAMYLIFACWRAIKNPFENIKTESNNMLPHVESGLNCIDDSANRRNDRRDKLAINRGQTNGNSART